MKHNRCHFNHFYEYHSVVVRTFAVLTAVCAQTLHRPEQTLSAPSTTPRPRLPLPLCAGARTARVGGALSAGVRVRCGSPPAQGMWTSGLFGHDAHYWHRSGWNQEQKSNIEPCFHRTRLHPRNALSGLILQ